MVAEVQLLDLIVHSKGRLVEIHLNFFQDDFLFHVEVILAKAGPHDVGQQVNTRLLVFRQDEA